MERLAGEGLRDRGNGGKRRTRRAKFWLVCPACGKEGFENLAAHLRGKECVKRHTEDEARRLYALARRDPRPWMQAVAIHERRVELLEKVAEGLPDDERKGILQALDTARQQLHLLRNLGPEAYEIPEEPLTVDYIFPRPKDNGGH